MELKKEYKKDGYTLTFLRKVEDWYIYEKVGNKESWMTNDPKPHWEVVTPVSNPRTIKERAQGLKGRTEAYPSNSAWGDKGFTLMTVADVNRKIKELTGIDISQDEFNLWHDYIIDQEVKELNDLAMFNLGNMTL